MLRTVAYLGAMFTLLANFEVVWVIAGRLLFLFNQDQRVWLLPTACLCAFLGRSGRSEIRAAWQLQIA